MQSITQITTQCLRRADNDFEQSAALWVAPGHVARHVGAEGLPLLPGERARLTIIPVQTHIRLWRVAVQFLPLPRKVCWKRFGASGRWSQAPTRRKWTFKLNNMQNVCRPIAEYVQNVCRLYAEYVHTCCRHYEYICRLRADRLQTYCTPFTHLMHTLFQVCPLTPSPCFG